jgi:hypothetical protein
MSSVLATTAASPGSKSGQETKFRNITTPSYYDDNYASYLPIPFSYASGILDINIQDAVQTFINNGDNVQAYSYSKVRQMGGTGLVQGLGPNLVSWLQNWWGGSPKITILQNAQVTRAQVLNKKINFDGFPYLYQSDMAQFLPATSANIDMYFDNWNNFDPVSPPGPASDNMLYTGEVADNYGSVVVFQSPLVVQFNDNGDLFNMVFTTQFENNYVANSFGTDYYGRY